MKQPTEQPRDFRFRVITPEKIVATKGGFENTWDWIVFAFLLNLFMLSPYVIDPMMIFRFPLWLTAAALGMQATSIICLIHLLRQACSKETIVLTQGRQELTKSRLWQTYPPLPLTGQFTKLVLKRTEHHHKDGTMVIWALFLHQEDLPPVVQSFFKEAKAQNIADLLADILDLPIIGEEPSGIQEYRKRPDANLKLADALEALVNHMPSWDEVSRQMNHFKTITENQSNDKTYSSPYWEKQKALDQDFAELIQAYPKDLREILSHLGPEDSRYLSEVYMAISEDLIGNADLITAEFERLFACIANLDGFKEKEKVTDALNSFGRTEYDGYANLWKFFWPKLLVLTQSLCAKERRLGIELMSWLMPVKSPEAILELEHLRNDPNWKVRVLASRYHNWSKHCPERDGLTLWDNIRSRFSRI